MAFRIANMFESFSFTDEEILEACMLSEVQRRYWQHRLSDVTMQKLNLTFDPAKPQDFMQQEAYARGRIDMLLELLLDQDTTLAQVVSDVQAEREALSPTKHARKE